MKREAPAPAAEVQEGVPALSEDAAAAETAATQVVAAVQAAVASEEGHSTASGSQDQQGAMVQPTWVLLHGCLVSP